MSRDNALGRLEPGKKEIESRKKRRISWAGGARRKIDGGNFWTPAFISGSLAPHSTSCRSLRGRCTAVANHQNSVCKRGGPIRGHIHVMASDNLTGQERLSSPTATCTTSSLDDLNGTMDCQPESRTLLAEEWPRSARNRDGIRRSFISAIKEPRSATRLHGQELGLSEFKSDLA